jgi:DNA polymerase I-like protein with 3'-5' exonuclease and polymerase domains
MFDPPSDWTATPVRDLPSWGDAKRVAIDCETRDPQLRTLGPGVRRDGRIVGISFAIEDGPAHYLPIRHASGGNLPEEHVLSYLRDQAAVFRGDVVGANLPYDLDFLAEEGIWFGACRSFRDVQVAEPLLDELQLSYSLDNIAARHGIPGKAEEGLVEAARAWGLDPKAELWKLPARHVAPYAIQDVRLPLALLRRQERRIDEESLWDVYNLESRVLPILVKMRRRGVRVDLDQLDRIEEWTEEQEAEALDVVYTKTGIRIELGDVWRPEPIARALEAIGVRVPKTKTGKPSTKADVVNAIDHDAARAISRARRMNKVRTTFVQSIRDHAIGDRIHCTFNQLRAQKEAGQILGAAYGRLSSIDPNMQQQPARDKELGPMWRSIYLPEEGASWGALDYSQQEPRMTVHYAVRTGCTRAEEAAYAYRTDPSTDNHQMMADLAGIERKAAKTIFLGLCYGMGGGKLCRSLGLPTRETTIRGRRVEVAGPEGEALLAKFDLQVPFVRELARKASLRAARRGYITTLSGRRCRFPRTPTGQYDWTHKALNRLIQGSSADQTKTAMVAMDAAGWELQLQIHDEMDLSVESREQAEEAAEIMRTCIELEVPSKVDVEIGPSWGEAK